MTLLEAKSSFVCGHAREYLIFTCLDIVDAVAVESEKPLHSKSNRSLENNYCINWI